MRGAPLDFCDLVHYGGCARDRPPTVARSLPPLSSRTLFTILEDTILDNILMDAMTLTVYLNHDIVL